MERDGAGEPVKLLSRVRLFATPWTMAYQAPRSMEFSRQEYWSGLPFPLPEDLPNAGTEYGSSALEAVALPSELPGKSIMGRGMNYCQGARDLGEFRNRKIK